MSDVDSLDGIVDDIDFDEYVDSKEDNNNSSDDKYVKTEEDLDDLLDDFFDSSGIVREEEIGNSSKVSDDIDEEEDLTTHIKLRKTHDLESALKDVPDPHLKKKWIDILKDEVRLGCSPPLKPSYAYLEWQDPVEHFSVDKSLRNIIIRACSKSSLDDAKAKLLQDLLFNDEELLQMYCKHILNDKRTDIKRSQDFDTAKYPLLAAELS